jgi:hypothetical protein
VPAAKPTAIADVVFRFSQTTHHPGDDFENRAIFFLEDGDAREMNEYVSPRHRVSKTVA